MRMTQQRSLRAVIVSLLMMAVWLPSAPTFAQAQPVRLFGPERIATAIELSREAWADGVATGVVLARHDNYPDALAGAPLAFSVGGPLLLTTPDGLWPDTAWEIVRVLPQGAPVILLGGVAALSEDVAWDLTDMGYDVYRADGASRYDTSVMVARAAYDPPQAIFVADGNDFPAALIAGAAAGSISSVVVLTNGTQLPGVVADYLDSYPTTTWVAVGWAASLALPGADVHIVGTDIYDDSRLLAEHVWDGGTDEVAVASGEDFPDGLAGAAHAAYYDIPLLLSPWEGVTDSVYSYLQSQAPLSYAMMYGGPAALSDQVWFDLLAAM